MKRLASNDQIQQLEAFVKNHRREIIDAVVDESARTRSFVAQAQHQIDFTVQQMRALTHDHSSALSRVDNSITDRAIQALEGIRNLSDEQMMCKHGINIIQSTLRDIFESLESQKVTRALEKAVEAQSAMLVDLRQAFEARMDSVDSGIMENLRVTAAAMNNVPGVPQEQLVAINEVGNVCNQIAATVQTLQDVIPRLPQIDTIGELAKLIQTHIDTREERARADWADHAALFTKELVQHVQAACKKLNDGLNEEHPFFVQLVNVVKAMLRKHEASILEEVSKLLRSQRPVYQEAMPAVAQQAPQLEEMRDATRPAMHAAFGEQLSTIVFEAVRAVYTKRSTFVRVEEERGAFERSEHARPARRGPFAENYQRARQESNRSVPVPSMESAEPTPELEEACVAPQLAGTNVPPAIAGTHVPPAIAGTHVPPAIAGTHVPPVIAGTYVPPAIAGTYVPPAIAGTYVPPAIAGTYVPPMIAST
ncbi:MAG: hypothetical protein EKK45_03700, partial [Curvibacter sp.]